MYHFSAFYSTVGNISLGLVIASWKGTSLTHGEPCIHFVQKSHKDPSYEISILKAPLDGGCHHLGLETGWTSSPYCEMPLFEECLLIMGFF